MNSRVLLFSFALWFMVQPSIMLGALLFAVQSTVWLHLEHDCKKSNVDELASESQERRAAVMDVLVGQIGNDLGGLVAGFDHYAFGDCLESVPSSIFVNYQPTRDRFVCKKIPVKPEFNARDFLREAAKGVGIAEDHVDHLALSVVTSQRTGRKYLGEQVQAVPLKTFAIAQVLPQFVKKD